ncbi:UdgX family uracil-DNA binding protein [Actinokineospora sp. HUAS TT18]|uniref:UdgX family uracil-DNA binding protein n=1 Tax=Actinokineospora sp. HUAS TT18 TaxID=3447451 RepID=UPI003F526BBF
MAVIGAERFVPPGADMRELREAVDACRGCALYRDATQAVFGDGPADAKVMMVGEQPGAREDIAGAPFVGPAGRLLDRAMVEAGLDRKRIYVTNAVKHFKFTRPDDGKPRIHKKPGRTEVVACRPWLVAELGQVQPDLLVCLGATAAQAVLGPAFRLTQHRGEVIVPDDGDFAGCRVLATVHPAAVLRSRDQDEVYAGLVDDLGVVAKQIGGYA